MKPWSRRTFLKAVPLGGAALLLDGPRRRGALADLSVAERAIDPIADEGGYQVIHTAREKIRDFDRTYADDFYLEPPQVELLETVAARIERAQSFIGHGHFNLVSFDELLRFADRYEAIGALTEVELEFLDEIFHADARLYGFHGRKVTERQTAVIDPRDVKKIPRTGHYLLRGEPLEKYERIRRDLGDGVYLTSGVRGVVKQYQLFLSKAVRTGGNLSQASRSLAPPGYSFHAIGDFDVGRVGFGEKNFTADFAETSEYKRLIDLGYVDLRYTETNPFGVRHEPWHIKIV